MKQTFLKGLHLLCGRAKAPAANALKETTQRIREAAPGQLCSLFAEVVEPEKIQGAVGSRKRLYTPGFTFWLMLGQVFRGGSLRSAARELQASFAATGSDLADTKGSSGSYSDARKRLEESELDKVNERVCAKMPSVGELLGGRRIMVVDGTGVQLEDTARNQDWFPQPSGQVQGCGFPVVQLLGLMNLERRLKGSATVSHAREKSGFFRRDCMQMRILRMAATREHLYGLPRFTSPAT